MSQLTAIAAASLDLFPCGLLVTDRDERTIIKSNKYFNELCGFKPCGRNSINTLFTKASRIMLESYVVPLLLNQRHIEEVQLTLQQVDGQRLPVLINARIAAEAPDLIYWTVTAAQQRDELYQELVNLRNHLEQKAETFSRLARTDELTGLLNRRAFIENANSALDELRRQQQSYAFFMIDVDNFKAINDQYGHDVGDQVLQEIAKIFQRQTRASDTLARVGGEEFAILASATSRDQVEAYAERLLQAVSTKLIMNLHVTISIGIALSRHHNLAELFKQADKLLYQVKSCGKNRALLFEF